MFGKLLLYFALLLWFVVPSGAQPTIILPTTTAEPDGQLAVDVQVANFESIVSAQFSIKWDVAVLQYDTVSNLSLPMLHPNQHFGTTNASQGVVVFAWLDETLVGVTKEDNSSIFTLNFTVIGEDEDLTSIWLDSFPAAIEFVDTSGIIDNNDIEIQNGSITVENPVATTDIQTALTLHQNFPNPFRKNTAIEFDLRTAQEVALTIYDIKGVKVLEHIQEYDSGRHAIHITNEQLPHEGTYLYELRTAEHAVINKLVLVK